MSLMPTSESPLGRGERLKLRPAPGGFFLATTHPEAFGFCPSQEGIDSLGMLSDNRSLMGLQRQGYH